MSDDAPLLEVLDLKTDFESDDGVVRAVDGVSFTMARGERLGMVGESGSGKTVTALSIMGLLPTPPAVVTGEVLLRGTDLLSLPRRELGRVRGERIAMIFQNPLDCLNPAMTVGAQIAEAILTHREVSKREAWARAVDLLDKVGIPAPARSADEYPHRFSGGMRQRVMIAIALSCEPELIIADEPTTALDVTTQAQILELLDALCEEQGTAVLLITHDLGVLAGFADRILVMYAGRLVEEGSVVKIYYRASHPYTWALMSSTLRLDESRRERLTAIQGNPPSGRSIPPGCPFHPRCPLVQELCREVVPELIIRAGDDHPSACHFSGELSPPSTLPRTGT